MARKTRLPLVLHGNFLEPLRRRLVQIEAIVAMKEDVSLEYMIEHQRN